MLGVGCRQHLRLLQQPCSRSRSQVRPMAAADPAPQQSQQPVYVVLVTGKVKPGMMPVFKEAFQPLAEHVTKNEPGCLTYVLSTGEDPDALCIYERYVSKEYLETVHWQSEPFKTFGAKVRAADLWVEKNVTKYWEEGPAYGFASR